MALVTEWIPTSNTHIAGFDGDRRRENGRGEREREKYKENVGARIQALGFSVHL
jgi:hypothetical protein